MNYAWMHECLRVQSVYYIDLQNKSVYDLKKYLNEWNIKQICRYLHKAHMEATYCFHVYETDLQFSDLNPAQCPPHTHQGLWKSSKLLPYEMTVNDK